MQWPFRGDKGDNYTKITNSAVETPIVPAYDAKFANLTQLVFANTSAAVCKVIIKDGLAGATRLVVTVLAHDTKIIGDGQNVCLEQAETGAPWTATSESIDSMEITAMFRNN